MVYINNRGQICCDDYLAHYGILGQKYGVRNGPPYPLDASDHSASERKAGWRDSLDGKNPEKYASRRKEAQKAGKKAVGAVRKVSTGDVGTGVRLATSLLRGSGLPGLLTSKRHREKRVGRLEEKAKKASAEDKTKKAEKLERKASAQKQKNEDMEKYLKKTSTAKLLVQDMLLRGIAADNYRSARARGAGRVRALLEGNAGMLPIGTLLRIRGDKKKYKAITHSAM